MKQNFFLKILVLLIAIILWLQQMFLKVHTESITIPIELENIPEKLIAMNVSKPTITVTLQAKGIDIFLFLISKPVFKIDTKDFRYGKNTIDLDKQNLIYTKNAKIEVKSLDFGSIKWISMESYAERIKPIQIEYASPKDEEFFLKNRIPLEQKKIKIKGPLSLVDKIKKIKTDKISKKMVTENKINVTLISPDGKIELEKKQIIFDLSRTRLIDKTISLIPIQFPIHKKIMIVPQKVSVIIRGPEDILDKLKSNSIRAYIEANKIKNKNMINIKFDIPQGIKLIDYTPQKVKIIRND